MSRPGGVTGGNQLLAVSLVWTRRELHAHTAGHSNLDGLPAECLGAGQTDRGSEFLDGKLHGDAHLVGVMPSTIALGHAHVPAFIYKRLPTRKGIDHVAALPVYVPRQGQFRWLLLGEAMRACRIDPARSSTGDALGHRCAPLLGVAESTQLRESIRPPFHRAIFDERTVLLDMPSLPLLCLFGTHHRSRLNGLDSDDR
jgi:hypothetical protein